MKTFLFQGDSITDVGRVREWADHLGAGYPAMAAGKVYALDPKSDAYSVRSP